MPYSFNPLSGNFDYYESGGGGGSQTPWTSDINADDNNLLNLNSVVFNPINAPTYADGQLYYDTDAKALSFRNDESDVSLQIGQEEYLRVRNSTGATITNGSCVYINGTHAGSGLPTVALAQADDVSTSNAIGVATHDILNNEGGIVTTFGKVNDLNLTGFTAGNAVYLSPTTAGSYTETEPERPDKIVQIGVVTKASATGNLLVAINKDPGALYSIVDDPDLTSTITELNYTDGVTSPIQTQIDAKADTSHNHTKSDLTDIADFLLESEVDADIKTLSLPASTTISTFGASLVDDADAGTARTTLGVDPAGTDNSTDVTLAGTPNYLTISGQEITRNAIDLTTDVTGVLPDANVANDITLTNITQITNRSHTDLSDIGTNTHAQIDTHIADATKHFTEASIDHGSISGLTDDDHTQYALLAGRSGGQSLYGGTALADNLHLYANDQADPDSYSTVHAIKPHHNILYDDSVTIEKVTSGFFNSWSKKFIRTSGVWTIEAGGNTGQAAVVSGDHTLRYPDSQAVTAAAVFQNQSIIQPTTGVTDGANSEWRGFFTNMQFQPDLSTAVTATATNIANYAALGTTNVKSGSHASSLAKVVNFRNYRSLHTVGTQGEITNFSHFDIANVTNNGTLDNQYGLLIADLTSATNNYAIYTGKGTHRIGDSTTDTEIGFFGATPINQEVLATGASATVDDVITALQNLGLVKQS